ncbi:response regulator transcription factor [Haloarchaeobius sp. HME9146]|uniref:response regulator transcription factor n=1 Tax=Haloarchaeobius sp. HME9146 TaxID=2978732 RepID=UPI0021C133B6|nr:response regulator [Haloarchaeobius sp. HME9146]MCT9097359.1 response regulator [Haloarchaeobius sp. HME9146]
MPSDDSERPSILIVDDEEKLANMYTLWLRADYDVETVYDGEPVIPKLDDVDVVLLDRRMPGYSGEEVLERIRDRDTDTSIILITAVDPDFDILELPFDDYLCKPVQHTDLVSAIEQQLTARAHSDDLQEYIQFATKQRLLEFEHSPHVLESNTEYVELRRRVDELEDQLRQDLDAFDEVLETYKNINRKPGRTHR